MQARIAGFSPSTIGAGLAEIGFTFESFTSSSSTLRCSCGGDSLACVMMQFSHVLGWRRSTWSFYYVCALADRQTNSVTLSFIGFRAEYAPNVATASSLWNSKAPRPMSTGKPSTRNATSRKTVDRTPRHRTRIPQKIDEITSIEMARKARIDLRLFSQVLRDENFDWQRHYRWTVEIGSAEHKAMHRVLNLIQRGAGASTGRARMAHEKPMRLQVDRYALSPR